MERLFPFAVAAVCFAVALLVPTTAGEPVAPEPTTTTTTPPRMPAAEVAIGTVLVHSAGEPMEGLPAEIETEVRRTLEDYLRAGSLEALARGRTAPELASLFTPEAGGALRGPDRSVLADDDLGPVERVRLVRAASGLVALAGVGGEIGAVVATVDWHVTGRSAAGAVRVKVQRTGELTLVPDGDRWRIDAFELAVEADRTAPTTTTAPGGDEDDG